MPSSTFSRLRRCCDPFKCHTKSRKTRTTTSDLRPVPRNLIASFPSLNLNPEHKICSMCRRKLYAMRTSRHTLENQDIASSHVTIGAEHQLPESQPAVGASVSSEDQSAQLDTAVDCEVSMEVIPETNVDQTEAVHPILTTNAQVNNEMDPGSDGSQDTDDGNASDGSQDTDDGNAPLPPCPPPPPPLPMVHRILMMGMPHSSQDDSSESRVLNEVLHLLGASPISKRKIQRHGNSYRQKKLKGILDCLSKKLGVNPSPDSESEIISQLKEKFQSTTKRSELVHILTVLPKSWSVQRIMKEFGTSKRMARRAKDLVDEKGILSTPNTKIGKCLPDATVQLLQDFYTSDEVSRAMPGKKDYISVGRKEHRQKRWILCNLKEAYEQFKAKHPGTKLGFSTFAMLRPKECVLAGASGTHTVCVCTLHQNTKLMFIGSKLATLRDGAFLHYRHCLTAIQCNPPSIKCYLSKCKQCPGVAILNQKLLDIMEEKMVDNIEYKQWTSADRSTMETITQPVEEFIETFVKALKKLQYHDFISKMQANYVSEAKENLGPNECLVFADFSENYSCVCQDAVQAFHWNKVQATIHPFLCYYRDGSGNVLSKCYLVISECTKHDTVAVHQFQRKLIDFLSATFEQKPSKIIYVSDGCAVQYKNRKNFINLCYHMDDFGVPAEWHFFATSHGKTAADGVAGTLKRLATKVSLQNLYENHTLQISWLQR